MAYSLTQYLEQCATARQEQMQWFDARQTFKSEREKEAYIAGMAYGMAKARELIQRHGKFDFKP